jgi:Mn-dependent DtxR family transcriptional regulator
MRYRESEEMYLETIFLLTKQKSSVRSVDVATELNYSRPSVSRAVNLLQKKGYISISVNGEITLTKSGEEKARNIYERHRIITEVLTKIGASEETAEENACRFEHAITPELLIVMKDFLEK